jgi:hypothetical protein
MSMVNAGLKAEAIRLRVEERRSLREIETITGSARSSLSAWLKPYPLTEEEKKARSKTAKRYVPPKKSHGIESKHYQSVVWQTLTNQQKGRIAEAAVLFRLFLHGFEVYDPIADGDKADWVVEVSESGSIYKIQVRCVTTPWKHGLPGINLRCAQGHNKLRRYAKGEFDFIVGYYLFNDTAYVYSFDEVAQHKAFIAISEEHAERWDKLGARLD